MNMKPIPGWDNYFIQDDGLVYSTKRKKTLRYLKPLINKGYAQAMLCQNSKHKTLKIHRLVAEAFIPNPENKPEVNHIDGNKLNNHVSNLEWATRGENCRHAIRTGLRVTTERQRENARNNGRKSAVKGKHGKKVINTVTGIIYNNITLAAASVGYKQGSLSKILSGVRRNKTNLALLSSH